MQSLELIGSTIKFDRNATVEAYSKLAISHPERCGCEYCKNFIAARPNVYPPDFKQLLDQLGIDFKKEAEVFHYTRMDDGKHFYGGVFHFVGEVEKDETCPKEIRSKHQVDFKWDISEGTPIAPGQFGDLKLCELYFDVMVPWILPSPEPKE